MTLDQIDKQHRDAMRTMCEANSASWERIYDGLDPYFEGNRAYAKARIEYWSNMATRFLIAYIPS